MLWRGYSGVVYNTFIPQIKGSFCGLNVMYHNHSSAGVVQLPCCATTFQWNVVQLPIGMHVLSSDIIVEAFNLMIW